MIDLASIRLMLNRIAPAWDFSNTLLVVALVGLAISLALPTFAQQKDTVDPKIAQQIRALAMKYDEAFNKNDAAALAAFYTEDGMLVTPHGTFHGRQAIEKDYAKHSFQQWQAINQVTKVDRIIAVGNEVRSIGKWIVIFELGPAMLIESRATIHRC
jgi:uncharacterized protein (TIGR02246 family)